MKSSQNIFFRPTKNVETRKPLDSLMMSREIRNRLFERLEQTLVRVV